MDEADTAHLYEEAARMAAHRKYDPAPAPTGYCHWCSEPVPQQRAYCDKFCQEDHEKYKRHNR